MMGDEFDSHILQHCIGEWAMVNCEWNLLLKTQHYSFNITH